ncbi:MAG: hypothetical protein J6X88_08130 [Bacteroidales bacterium]|nr:hypothetical protein [Bacteroidales bacterium]
MKKILLTISLVGGIMASAFANGPEQPPMASDNPTDETITVTVISVSNTAVELLVEANNVVNDVCNYFNGSWVDYGLKIYCSLGGDVYTCTAYKITKMACSISGAIKLYMEGDINNATKRILATGAEVWAMTKMGDKIKLSPSNMCVGNLNSNGND